MRPAGEGGARRRAGEAARPGEPRVRAAVPLSGLGGRATGSRRRWPERSRSVGRRAPNERTRRAAGRRRRAAALTLSVAALLLSGSGPLLSFFQSRETLPGLTELVND